MIKKTLTLILVMISSHLMASPDITWSPQTTLSTAGVNASDPQVVIDANGNVTAAWVENNVVMANTHPISGNWGTAVSLSGTGGSAPKLGVDSSGNVTAIWVENGVITSRTLPFNGSWSAATAVSDSVSGGASAPQLSVDSTGNAVAIWQRSGNIETSTKLSGGNWDVTPSMLANTGNDSVPDVAIGGNGRVVAVWHTISSGNDTLFFSTKTISGGTWSTGASMLAVSPAFRHNYPSVIVDANGNATAIWYRYTLTDSIYSNVNLLAATLASSSSTWSPIPTVFAGNGLRNPAELYTRLGVDNTGNVIALWTNSYDGETFNIESAVKPVTGDWATGGALVLQNLYSFEADVATSSLGASVSLYMFHDGSSLIVQSTETQIGGTSNNFWSVPLNVSTGSNNGFPRVAASLAGSTTLNAAGVWISFNGTNNTIQAVTGSRPVVAPPTNLSVTQNVNNFGVFSDYYNTLTWTASTDPEVVAYNIYRNGLFFAQVDATTLQFIDNNAVQNGAVTYGVAALDNQASQSPVATVNFP